VTKTASAIPNRSPYGPDLTCIKLKKMPD